MDITSEKKFDRRSSPQNRLKANLKAGKVQIGAFVTAPCPEVVEVLGATGYDFVILDTEHTASGIETVVDMMRAAEIYGMSPVVRVPNDTPKNIARYLDVGAYGVQVPMVHTADQARAIVRAMKYPPEGERGMSGGRGPRWGLIENYRQTSNEEALVAVMCESVEGLKNIDEIVRVPGIDTVFIGAFDLSQSLGMPGQTTHPIVEDAIQTILNACKRAEVIPGIVAPSLELTRKRIEQGFLYVTTFDDMAFFADAAAKRLDEIRS